jgi:enamine deaminase RidA (YjgF/YER057c/UK114 family)
MEKLRRTYPDIAPARGQFYRAVRAGDFLFIAGTTARASEAETGSMAEQFEVTVNRLKAIVEAEGGSARDLVMFTTYVTSIEEWNACASEREAAYERCFEGEYPTNTLVEISALALPGLKVEIEAIAVL